MGTVGRNHRRGSVVNPNFDALKSYFLEETRKVLADEITALTQALFSVLAE